MLSDACGGEYTGSRRGPARDGNYMDTMGLKTAHPSGSRFVTTCSVLALCAALAGWNADEPTGGQSKWSFIAAHAKRRGATAEEIRVGVPALDQDVPPLDVLSRYSALVARVTHLKAATSYSDAAILSWHEIEIEESLVRRQPTPQAACAISGTIPSVRANRVPLRIIGGTITVDDVAISMVSDESDIPWRVGRSYLLIGSLCPTGELVLVHAGDAVFPLSEGTVGKPLGLNSHRFGEYLTQLGTLERVRRAVLAADTVRPSMPTLNP